MVLGWLLYGSETWAPIQELVGSYVSWTGFIATLCLFLLGISIRRTVQWKEHLTTVELAEHFGMEQYNMVESIGDLRNTQYGLRWLGHVARI